MKSQRRTTTQRKIEIIQTTLKLAESMPVTKITTRKIAWQIGISQPALFRHYKSSSQIFEAVIEHVRNEIGKRATVFFQSDQLQASDLKTKLQFIMTTLSEFPGLPRLFYYYSIQSRPSEARSNLMHLLSTVQTMIATIIKEDSEIPEDVDEITAAKYLISLIQGQQLEQCQPENAIEKTDSELRFKQTIENTVAFWFVGLKAGYPHRKKGEKEQPICEKIFIDLDVRSNIAAGEDPLAIILEELNHLLPEGCLRLTAPFQPKPLIAMLQGRGYRVTSSFTQNRWLCFIHAKTVQFHNFTDLEAPLPLEKTLEVSAGIQPGETLWVHVPRVPNLLFPHLKQRDIQFTVYSGDNPPVLLRLKKDEVKP